MFVCVCGPSFTIHIYRHFRVALEGSDSTGDDGSSAAAFRQMISVDQAINSTVLLSKKNYICRRQNRALFYK